MRANYFLRNSFFLILFAFLGYVPTVSGQTTPVYGNEWINYSQTYYKVKVVKTGMHRLTYADLTSAGVSGVNPEKFQLFRRGQEVAVYVNGQADHVFNAGDYIEFYGEKNDGKMDVPTYKVPTNQVHQYYSLYSDTSAYFLTWGTQNGKRMQTKVSVTAGLTPEPRHYAEALRLKTNFYSNGERTARSWGDLGEGFVGDLFGNSKRDTIKGLINLETTGRPPVLEPAVVGWYIFNSHQVKFMVTPPTGSRRVLTNSSTGPTGIIAFPSMQYRKPKFNLLHTDITTAGVLTVRAHIPDSLIPPGDYMRMAYYKVTYARINNLNSKNQLIITDSVKTTPSYFLFTNPPANALAYDITDPYNVIRTEGVTSGAQKGFVFDPSTSPRRILIVNGLTPYIPTRPKSLHFRQINATAYDYIIVTHASLHSPVAGTPYNDPPRDYAAYRASPAGNSYRPIVLDMDSVYNQYHYGEQSPQAITNLMSWFLANGQPKFLMLMGKGYENSLLATRTTAANLVPTAGAPASDVLYTSDWRNNSFFPRVPTGRISVKTSADIVNYLEKVKGHDTLGVQDWRKNMLHLGGGHDAGEIAQFSRYLNNYKIKAEGPFLGAKVKTIIRNNSGGLVNINVKNEINTGLSLLTFFGHSSGNTSDIDIGYVTDPINGYNNPGKYPMILMNGCLAGNAFKPLNGGKFSFGEDWTLAPQKGAILFLGSTSDQSIPYALNNYSGSFYTTAFTDSAYYGKTIGEIQKRTIERSAGMASPTDLNNIEILCQMVLQGDPAVRLFAPEKPDYFVKTGGLNLQSDPPGGTVNSDTEHLDLVIDVKNPGKAIDSSLVVSVKRFLPNGDSITYPSQRFSPVYNESTVHFKIDNRNVAGFGTNIFEVTLDYGNHVSELNESNNTATLSKFLAGNGVLTLMPSEFSIVGSSTVTLVGQPADLVNAVARDYYFELDTVPTFNSAVKTSAIIRNATTSPSWTTTLLPSTAPNDSLVYYWRLRFNTFTGQQDTIWATSSFRYIPNSPPGWSQSHHGQFAKDNTTGITINQTTRQWEFSPLTRELQLSTAGGGVTFTAPGPYGILIDQTAYFDATCLAGTTPRILAVVLKPNSLEPYNKLAYPLCGRAVLTKDDFFYTFLMSNTSGVNAFGNFLKAVPNGYYVALVSVNNVPFSVLTPAQKANFKLIGSQMIDTLKTGYPFAIVGRKGAVTGTLVQEKTYDNSLGTAANMQAINFTVNLNGQGNTGTIVSTKIGPATSWTTLHHTVKKTGSDQYNLSLYGFNQSGTRAQLNPNIQGNTFSLSTIDATQYPFLQLEMTKTDTLASTPPQLKQWMVTYAGVPEGILRRDLTGGPQEDISVQASKGNVRLRFAFTNISDFDFADSLTVVRSVIGSKPLQDTITIKKLLAHDSVFFDYNFSTAGMKGNNTVRVEVNPQFLPELHYFNNFLEIPFTLAHSDLPPVLDVAFDGIHIMDGDIVSPSPHIAINLKDEDKFNFVQDPEKLEVFLLRPGALTYEKIDVKDASLVTLPNMADPGRDKRDFTITYNPKNLPDGIYKLRVQGRDNSENEAGFEPYSISFEVINESSISNFYPYPNPFSSNTRFVFTLTGYAENMPRNLKIQIMTLTGKVVREIQKEELGLIRVGNNISLPWDGTDEFGDKLANGAYLYRVVMEKAPLEEMKHRKTAGDKSFKKEYGKLYILR
jgi:hypothetical protein